MTNANEKVWIACEGFSWGKVCLAATQKGLIQVLLGSSLKDLKPFVLRKAPGAQFIEDPRMLKESLAWFRLYSESPEKCGKRPSLDMRGTDFELRVWKALARVKHGELVTYGELAARAHCPSPRAVGQAVGRNPLAVVIPCHRVIAANQGLGGFSGGLDIKIRLLRHEGVEVDETRKKVLALRQDM